jgi:hypothetical protein
MAAEPACCGLRRVCSRPSRSSTKKWEEVYLIEGDLTVGNDAAGQGGESFPAGTYACRPPGAVHGPFKSNGGCLLYEIHYYAE